MAIQDYKINGPRGIIFQMGEFGIIKGPCRIIFQGVSKLLTRTIKKIVLEARTVLVHAYAAINMPLLSHYGARMESTIPPSGYLSLLTPTA